MLNVQQLITLLERCVTVASLAPGLARLPIFEWLTQYAQELRSASTLETQLDVLKKIQPLVGGGMGSLDDMIISPPNSTPEERRNLNSEFAGIRDQLYTEVKRLLKKR